MNTTKYNRAKTWQIALFALNMMSTNMYLFLMSYVSYYANGLLGMSVVFVSTLATSMRIFDGFTDPIIGWFIDHTKGRFGKFRPFLVVGNLLLIVSMLLMYKTTHLVPEAIRIPYFVVVYALYIIGYTVQGTVTTSAQTLLTNDPKQRPTLGVWVTALNYMVPMALTMLLNVVLLPKFGGTYSQEFLSAACKLCLTLAAIGVVLVCIGVSEYDKPENFQGLTKERQPLKVKDMVEVLKGNRPLQCYIISAASDKIAQVTASQAMITTMLSGIIIGNMGISTILTVIGMLPSILFAVVGAKYAGKHGNMETIVTWTKICIVISVVMCAFFVVINPKDIAKMGAITIVYVVLTLCKNGANMCVTTANTAFMSDLIDYELDRSGRYVPAVVTGTYSFLDKLISSFGAAIATGAVALVGYTTTVPQPGDPATPAIFWLTMFLTFGLPIIGWICTLAAMKFCKLNKAEMVEVQKRIAAKKEALKAEK